MNNRRKVEVAFGIFFTLFLVGAWWSASGRGLGMQESPDADQLTADGFYRDFKTKNSPTHFTEVNEVACNGRTDVVIAVVPGARDSYAVNLSGVPIGAQITSIDVRLCASGEKSPKRGIATLKTFYRLNGTDSIDHDAPSLTGSVPVTLQSTAMAANVIRTSETALEVGVLYASGTEGAHVSQVAVSIIFSMLVKPGTLSIEEPSPQALRVRWEDVATIEDGYSVERSTDGVTYVEVIRTSAGATEFIDVGLLPSKTYHYRVRAFNVGGYSEASQGSRMTSLLRPATPVKLGAVVRDASTISLEWGDESTSEDGYWIQRSLEGFNFTNIDQVGKDVSVYTGTGLTPGVTYYYRVYAYNADWTSSFSNVTSVATLAP